MDDGRCRPCTRSGDEDIGFWRVILRERQYQETGHHRNQYVWLGDSRNEKCSRNRI